MDTKNIAIRAENLSKCYRIGVKATRRDTFSGTIIDFLKNPLTRYRKYRSLYRFDDITFKDDARLDAASDVIWALKDVSFEVREGEVLGIIGRNGAGKSTLLKIIAKIADPTSGYAEIRGRISSLLEVGTGFHPELTGRENIYLNGTILGMKKREIDRQFDAIVDFSEVEKFLDTPVKRYSSGMRVRLAFSVAAHLEPEILVIDEVLAVGDIAFQKKCLGKMEGVAREGRTVIFVSHSMGVISELCTRCMLMHNGEVLEIGDTKDIVSKYVSSNSASGEIDLRQWSVDRVGRGPMRILNLNMQDEQGQIRSQFSYGEPIMFNIRISGKRGAACILGVTIRDPLGHIVLHFASTDDSAEITLPADESEIYMCLPRNILNDGMFYVTVWLGDGLSIEHDVVRNCLNFTVESSMQGRVKCRSSVRVPAQWQVKEGIQQYGIEETRHQLDGAMSSNT